MPRVKRGTTHVKRRRSLLKKTKGYQAGRKKLIKLAKPAALKAGAHARAHRRAKKGVRRRLWQIQINAAVRERGMTYSTFIHALGKHKIEIDRKILAKLAQDEPKVFDQIVERVKT